MENPDYIAAIAALFSLLSAVYANRTWQEAKRSNDLSRLNLLLALKQHYSELMQLELDKSSAWMDGKGNKRGDGYTEACSNAYADYQQKYREISARLEGLKACCNEQ